MCRSMASSSKNTPDNLEDGELHEPETNEVPTPLGKVHREKMRDRLNADRIRDSLERPSKAPKRPRNISQSSDEEESSLESSFMT